MVFFLMSTLESVAIILFCNIYYLVQSSNLLLQNCLFLLSPISKYFTCEWQVYENVVCDIYLAKHSGIYEVFEISLVAF
jgi:hypothetical protein